MLGDEGSAYWLAHQAVKTCMLEQDNYAAPPYHTSYVWEEIKAHFNIENRFGLLSHCHGDFNKTFYSSLTVRLAKGAADGDKLCLHLFKLCGEELGKHVVAVIKHVHPELYQGPLGLPIVCVGSVWKSWKFLKPGFESVLGLRDGESPKLKRFSLVRLNVPSCVGAALLGAHKYHLPRNMEKNVNVFYSLGLSNGQVNGNGQA
jgi:N-acetylglucosamine kinase